MKIGIDISQIVYGTGVSVYTKELVRNLLQIDTKNEYVLFGGSARNQEYLRQFALSLSGNFQTKFTSLSPQLADFVWNRIHRLRIEKFTGNLNLFHSSDWTQPPSNCPKVTTVHDLSPFKFPELTHPKIVSVHKRKMYWVLREVDRIIVPSNATKNDLIKLGGKEERIRVIPEAAGEKFKIYPREIIEEIKKKYEIRGQYLITVGMGERKNTKRLIDAFQRIKRNDLKLLIVGHKNIDLSNTRGIMQVGYVPDMDLPLLYGGASALVYPSLYEGFGLPILQAFACGCPVVTSNISSLSEVAADAAVLVDPYDVSVIADGIKEALNKPKHYQAKGLKRAMDFSWEETARQTLAVYSEFEARS